MAEKSGIDKQTFLDTDDLYRVWRSCDIKRMVD